MKIKDNYLMRKTGGTYVIVPLGKEVNKLNGIIRLNESAADLFKTFQKGCTRDGAIKMLLDTYSVDEETAGKSVDAFVAEMDKLKLFEG